MLEQRSLTIKTRLEDLEFVDAAVDQVADKSDWTPKLVDQIKLVLEELIVNVIRHGHDDSEKLHDIHVSVSSDDSLITLELEDHGKPFDLLKDAPDSDTESDIKDRAPGGLGVYLVMQLTDEVTYRRENNMNKLKLIKRKDTS